MIARERIVGRVALTGLALVVSATADAAKISGRPPADVLILTGPAAKAKAFGAPEPPP